MDLRIGLPVVVGILAVAGGFVHGADNDPRVVLRPAPLIQFQRAATNSPAHWNGRTLYVFNGAAPPHRWSGPDLLHQNPTGAPTEFDTTINGNRWFEATWKDDDGTLYGWYHNEPRGVCTTANLTAPRIGAARSVDDGLTWTDLGFVLEAPADSLACETPNAFYAGGVGDFSVLLDDRHEHFYFFLSTFDRDVAEQGVAVARMSFARRNEPAGHVWKWRDGNWNEPGLGGHVTPILPAGTSWHDPAADVFWGPSVHWNTHLSQYVMLLNRAGDSRWTPAGFYVSFNRNLDDPRRWTAPTKLEAPPDATPLVRTRTVGPWYVHVIGLDHERLETDKRAGRTSRLFIHGESHWEIEFHRPRSGASP